MYRFSQVSVHARKRMAERNVTQAEGEYVLNNAHSDLPGNSAGSRKLTGTVSGREVSIVVRHLGGDDYRFISCW